jgi:hypothetical protein
VPLEDSVRRCVADGDASVVEDVPPARRGSSDHLRTNTDAMIEKPVLADRRPGEEADGHGQERSATDERSSR